ncbi:uncharacterized protein MELLADRAFT_110173 [Melampsora larici-populina 98AG31]|uniref:AB hydrolase-1 domain-containing protein n=1 Tax=Melampsora larici-populina (strain 98AG31 / pathotype 3-4-7) TaxID=747676 RepID=F4RYX3_MELLP|nr:uncharacterized protein MELLADRAFT_110173 [Melampsora larici-populina 98AG31]EGG02428.1 hypothetical protein MELLADRAFT_110173 [Melampsora larici-populina 98AG31]
MIFPLMSEKVGLVSPASTTINTLPNLPPRPITCSNRSPFQDLVGTKLNQWSLSNHIFPAAYPRTLKGSSLPNQPNLSSTKLIRSEDRNQMAHMVYEANRTSPRLNHTMKVDQVDEQQLYVSVNRYFRTISTSSTHSNQGLTLILSHANGLHKETWEPMLSYLLQSPQSDLIHEIWSLDCINQGDSAILNQDSLGERFYWADTSRDLLQFIISYLPESQTTTHEPKDLPRMLSQQVLPNPSILNLSRTPSPTKPMKWRDRKICLIGHSLGGFASAITMTTKPELIHSMILIDPVINPALRTDQETETILKYRTSLSVHRRSKWNTYEKLKTLLRSNQDFKPLIAYIFADENRSVLDENHLRYYIDEINSQGLKVVRIMGTGHLVVQEVPEKLAGQIALILKEFNHDSIRYKL